MQSQRPNNNNNLTMETQSMNMVSPQCLVNPIMEVWQWQQSGTVNMTMGSWLPGKTDIRKWHTWQQGLGMQQAWQWQKNPMMRTLQTQQCLLGKTRAEWGRNNRHTTDTLETQQHWQHYDKHWWMLHDGEAAIIYMSQLCTHSTLLIVCIVWGFFFIWIYVLLFLFVAMISKLRMSCFFDMTMIVVRPG